MWQTRLEICARVALRKSCIELHHVCSMVVEAHKNAHCLPKSQPELTVFAKAGALVDWRFCGFRHSRTSCTSKTTFTQSSKHVTWPNRYACDQFGRSSWSLFDSLFTWTHLGDADTTIMLGLCLGRSASRRLCFNEMRHFRRWK